MTNGARDRSIRDWLPEALRGGPVRGMHKVSFPFIPHRERYRSAA
jgi:hypothetical protein